MPITKSAKKSLAVSRRKQAMNQVQEIELAKALKKVSATNINEVISKIDKAAKTHLISKNKAGRLKSRLMKKFSTPAKKKIVTGKQKTVKKSEKGKK